jgi:creatinine amidohydrolase
MTIHEWAKMTGRAIDALDRKRTVLLVSCSPLEVHGPHLPTMADVREADGLLEKSAELLAEKHTDITFVRFPWMWTASDVLPHVGSIKFKPSTVALVLTELGESLAKQGFEHLWVGSFHGGPRHVLALEKACSDVRRTTGMGMLSVFSLMLRRLTGGSSDLAALLDGVGGITREELKGDSHGGLVETAILLHLVGEHVDRGYDALPPRSIEIDLAERGEKPMQKGEKATLLELVRSFPLRQQYYERETYAGAPAKATAELGREYLAILAREAASALSDVYTGSLPYEQCHSPLWPFRRVLLSETVGVAFDKLVSTRPSPV